MKIDGFDITTVEGAREYLKENGVDVDELAKKAVDIITRKEAMILYRDKGVSNDLGHGKCVEKGCDRWAVKDYNGHGCWNCQTCYDANERYFEEEYR